jgi:hypothetical protein
VLLLLWLGLLPLLVNQQLHWLQLRLWHGRARPELLLLLLLWPRPWPQLLLLLLLILRPLLCYNTCRRCCSIGRCTSCSSRSLCCCGRR